MKTHAEYKTERASRDGEFKVAYDALEEEYELRRGVISARIEKGLTQAELADRLGTTQSAVSRLESGEFNPRVETLSRLAGVLGVEFRIAGNGSRVVPARSTDSRRTKGHTSLSRRRRSTSTSRRIGKVAKKPNAA